jgi:TfoX N-terminal domain
MRSTPDMPERVARRGCAPPGFVAERAAVCTIVAMAYDQELAEVSGSSSAAIPNSEKEMFGGLAFVIRGNMAIAASSEGGAMVRVDPAQSDSLVATTKATPMNLRGRDMPGWLRVSSDDLRTRPPARPLGRVRHRIRALAAAQIEARLSTALRPPGPATLIIWMVGCVVVCSHMARRS